MARAFFICAAALLLASVPASGAGHAAPNAIAAENALPGTTSWQRPYGRAELYGSEISAAPGDDLHLHVSTADSYRIVVYRLGWYGGAGARRLACEPGCDSGKQGTVQQGAHGSNPVRADWPVTDVVHTGSDWVSGYYLVEAVLTSGPTAGSAAKTFVILHPAASAEPSPILVQAPVNTWEAYNHWGGQSLYDMPAPRGTDVTFDRPFGEYAQTPMWWEIQLVRFLEREGYDVSYQADTDLDQHPDSLLRHQLVIVNGHAEYWSKTMHDAMVTAQAEGTNVVFTGSNDIYWQIRYADGDRTIEARKLLDDPGPLPEKTAMFRQVGPGEACIMGVAHDFFAVQGHALDFTVTAAGAADPLLAGTGLKAGDAIAGIVGREHDRLHPWPEECVHPGLTVLWHYAGTNGDQDGDGVEFTFPDSGARVFASGGQMFNWALDSYRAPPLQFTWVPVDADRDAPVDPRVQQFMRNVLAAFVRPAAPSGLTATVSHRRVTVRVGTPLDPRTSGFVATAKTRRGSWRVLCRGVTSCTARPPRGRGAFVVGAVAVNEWNLSSSTAAYAVAHR